MGLQKKNQLLRAHLVVAVFWFVTLYLVMHGLNLKRMASTMSYSLLVMVGGAICGILVWLMFSAARKQGVLDDGGEHNLRSANCTLGPLPTAKAPQRGRVRDTTISARFPGWVEYQKKHPAHAKAFRAVLAVMEATPKLPAAPVAGGHGGATLIEHSLNVVEMLMKMAPAWSYKGHKNKKGEIAFPLLDTTRVEFRFAKDDPILPLAAFAHDIGKVVCYQLNKDGSVTEVRKNHDIEGARLLRSLPEIMELPWADQVALLISCEYYHHIGSIPYSTWIDDRARALIELLIAADIATGQKEGGVIVGEYEDADVILQQAEQAQQQPDDAQEPANTPAIPAAAAQAPAAKALATDADAVYGSPYDLAYAVLLESGRVNGGNSLERVAWKHGQWLYINDFKLRNAVSKKTGDSSYNALPHRGQMHSFTLGLMAELSMQGHLLQEFEGRTYSEKRAIFTTQSSVLSKKDKTTKAIETQFVIVAKVKAFPGLENAADCKNEPKIVACSWGESAAVNKKGGLAQSAEQGQQTAPEASQDKHEPEQEQGHTIPGRGAAAGDSAIDDGDLPLASWEIPASDATETADTTGDLPFDLPTDGDQADAPGEAEVEAQAPEGSDEVAQAFSSNDEIALLLEAVDSHQLPFVKKEFDGKAYYLFDESILKDLYPGLQLQGDAFIRRSGGKSGKTFVGIEIPT